MEARVQEIYEILEMTTHLRNELLQTLTDEDLQFALPANKKLGVLCREIGEVQQSYIDSLRDHRLTFDYRADDPEGLESSVEKLRTWYAGLDARMREVIEGFSDEQLTSLMIYRGNYGMSLAVQIHTYREALLIFYGKVSIYLPVLGKSTSPQWDHWIG